jgi:hypothetical protein
MATRLQTPPKTFSPSRTSNGVHPARNLIVVKDLKITYPVAVDSTRKIWNAFRNQI